jgi:hypothetical protein
VAGEPARHVPPSAARFFKASAHGEEIPILARAAPTYPYAAIQRWFMPVIRDPLTTPTNDPTVKPMH